MKKIFSRLLAFFIVLILTSSLLSISTKATESVADIFVDVKADAWYITAVQYVYDNGIMIGTGSIFGVNNPLKREQFAATLYSMAGKPVISTDVSNPFTDVPSKNGYPRDAILWAIQNGIAAGNADGTFGVGQSIQRQAVASMLYKYATKFGYDTTINEDAITNFVDVSKVQSWAVTPMKWAVTQGIISGKGGNRLDPTGTATRAECAMMIMNLITKQPAVITDPKVGSIIKYGRYEQDGDETNGKEEIEWQVLKVEDNRILLISKYALDVMPYATKGHIYFTYWENCTLRKWLNNDFKSSAFSYAEAARIPTVELENKNNRFGGEGGNNTQDQIFCLSLEELDTYFGECNVGSLDTYGCNEKIICAATKYAVSKGAYDFVFEENGFHERFIPNPDSERYLAPEDIYSRDVIGCHGTEWWLRSPGSLNDKACIVWGFGGAGAKEYTSVESTRVSIRPAMYLEY